MEVGSVSAAASEDNREVVVGLFLYPKIPSRIWKRLVDMRSGGRCTWEVANIGTRHFLRLREGLFRRIGGRSRKRKVSGP